MDNQKKPGEELSDEELEGAAGGTLIPGNQGDTEKPVFRPLTSTLPGTPGDKELQNVR